MYECKSSGGHFFVHSPHLRSFICHRCREPFTNYNPPIPRTKAAKQWYSELYGSLATADADREKAPWRCIVEACAFTTCGPCSDVTQGELGRLKDEREAAEAAGTPYDFQAELAKVEDEGRVGIESARKREIDVDKDDNKKENDKMGHSSGDSAGKISVDSRMEVDDDDGDGDEYSLEVYKRPYTRSATAAAASARARARRPTAGKREREPTRRRGLGD
ncbi:hypothetical protein FN846DRAFT_194420 [Sphaerosporella brunnea]|uniref:Uncharacterized protein n=1 Tax=Sphaerosporella brunnea TaxID=1250544 RepID=A0A5J5EQ56_9PEZI|nr:hypothetical protein FN846DRAFT_194420 [Sphaerosporella brunnea]